MFTLGGSLGVRSIALTNSRESNCREAVGAHGVPGKNFLFQEDAIWNS